jgi:hypothetical protein
MEMKKKFKCHFVVKRSEKLTELLENCSSGWVGKFVEKQGEIINYQNVEEDKILGFCTQSVDCWP